MHLTNKEIAEKEFPIVSKKEFNQKINIDIQWWDNFQYSTYVMIRKQQREAFIYGLQYSKVNQLSK